LTPQEWRDLLEVDFVPADPFLMDVMNATLEERGEAWVKKHRRSLRAQLDYLSTI
jgi:hypothetical protein